MKTSSLGPGQRVRDARRRVAERIAQRLAAHGRAVGGAEPPLWRLAAMARRLGIDPVAMPETLRRKTGTACVDCLCTGECELWLAAGKVDGAARFCPNAARFAQLRHAGLP
jgi:hypothetical protein